MRVGIYNRCSTEEEHQQNALGVQVAESRELVKEKGWTVTAHYVELQSGTIAYKREEYQRLLRDIEKDVFDIVVIKSIDRLTRSTKDWYVFLDRLVSNNKRLYIYIEQKFYTPEDNLLTGIKAILAEDFSRELSKKIKNAHRRRQEKKSGFNITVPMFGWDKVGKDSYIINEEEAKAYRLAFSLAEEGKGFYSIANIMYDKGIRSKNGTRIADVQWRKMLYSKRAHGTIVLRKTEYDFETKKVRNLPEEDWIEIEDALPPIVSREYQEQVLEKIRVRTKENHFTDYTRDMTKNGLYDFSRKIYCSECQKPFYRTIRSQKGEKIIVWKCSTAIKKGKYHGCNNRSVREEELLEIIKARYVHSADDERIVKDILKIIKKGLQNGDGTKRIINLEKEMSRLEWKKRQLSEKWLNDSLEDLEYSDLVWELEKRKREIQHQLVAMKEQNEKETPESERLKQIEHALQNGILLKARTKEIMTKAERIIVFPNGELDFEFH